MRAMTIALKMSAPGGCVTLAGEGEAKTACCVIPASEVQKLYLTDTRAGRAAAASGHPPRVNDKYNTQRRRGTTVAENKQVLRY